jgi:hypothetical protein
MSAKSHDRGHETFLKNGQWYYSDTKELVDDKRACKKCGKKPSKEGYDACLGHIKGLSSACCGHGISEPINQKEQ